MSQSKTKNATEDLVQTLMKELNLSENDLAVDELTTSEVLTFGKEDELQHDGDLSHLLNDTFSADYKNSDSNGETHIAELNDSLLGGNLSVELPSSFASMPETPKLAETTHTAGQPQELVQEQQLEEKQESDISLNVNQQSSDLKNTETQVSNTEKTVVLAQEQRDSLQNTFSDSEKTVAIAGYANRAGQSEDNHVRVSVGQSRGAYSQGYASWGASDSQLAQAENLKIAQEKILELEKENEKLRLQNEELIAASEIVKERADLLTSQIHEYKNDKDSLEQSFKNELNLVKNQYNRKDAELQKAQQKIDELDSRLKFDMRKIRIRERELENRLELIRAEKNALVKSKDESILDLRRKLDQLQMEVESYRQKCVELNKVVETNQDSFKRTTRALRLAMANLELQEENKAQLKKVD